MALETLAGLTQIGGYKIVRDKPEGMSWDAFDKMRVDCPINITDRVNCISFKLQNGPIKEVGINGCQIDTLIQAAQIMLEGLDEKFPCKENRNAIYNLRLALEWLVQRKKNREIPGVEGLSKA